MFGFLYSWQFLAVLATFIWAVGNLVDKYFLSSRFKSTGSAMALACVSYLGVVVGLLVLSPFAPSILFPGAVPLALLVFSGVLWAIGVAAYYEALRAEEVSRIVPFFLLDPFFTAVLAMLLLGESFPPVVYFGILLLVAGAMLVSTRSLRPFSLGRGFWLALAATIMFSVASIAIKQGVAGGDAYSGFFWHRAGLFLGSLPFAVLYGKRAFGEAQAKASAARIFFVSNMASALGGFFFVAAVSRGFVTLVSAISSTQPVFVLAFVALLGIFKPGLLREELAGGELLRKAIAVLVMVIGSLVVLGAS